MLLSVPKRMRGMCALVCCFFCVCVKRKRSERSWRNFTNPSGIWSFEKLETETPSSVRGGRKGEIWGRRNVKCIDQEAASHSSSVLGPPVLPQERSTGHLHSDRPPARILYHPNQTGAGGTEHKRHTSVIPSASERTLICVNVSSDWIGHPELLYISLK